VILELENKIKYLFGERESSGKQYILFDLIIEVSFCRQKRAINQGFQLLFLFLFLQEWSGVFIFILWSSRRESRENK
jgi:hypothetical protein